MQDCIAKLLLQAQNDACIYQERKSVRKAIIIGIDMCHEAWRALKRDLVQPTVTAI